MMNVHQSATAKELSEDMAKFIEVFLGNAVVRRALNFCTARCKRCGRRIEVCLKKYIDHDTKLCTKCRFAYLLLHHLFDYVLGKLNVSPTEVASLLKDPMWRKGLASVLEGIAKYGPTKPFTAFAPFLVVWNVTHVCNLRCHHCYAYAGSPTHDELTPKEALDAVDHLAEAGVAYIALSGGEPLLRKDLWNITSRITQNEMAFSIATNGTLLTKAVATNLKKSGCTFVQVSLDGVDPETHNDFRGAGVFRHTVQGVQNAVDAGICTGIATTVTKLNYHEVPEILELTERLGADLFIHYNFIPTGRGNQMHHLDLTPYERETLLMMLAGQIGKRNISILSTAPQYARICTQYSAVSLTHFDNIGQREEFKESVKFLADFVGGCGTGRLYCALDANGDILPCVFLPIKVGNIRSDDLLTVWHASPVFEKIRNRSEFKEACGACKHSKTCGGCRARAYAYSNDVTQSDVGCIIASKRPARVLKQQLQAPSCARTYRNTLG